MKSTLFEIACCLVTLVGVAYFLHLTWPLVLVLVPFVLVFLLVSYKNTGRQPGDPYACIWCDTFDKTHHAMDCRRPDGY